MSLEIGGRADKYGNEYERQFLARLLLRVVRGDYKYVIIEPLGENSDSVEFITEDTDCKVYHYQCKSSNGSQSHWRVCDLNAHKVFERSKKIITESTNNIYKFVSPLQYGELAELCKRARTNQATDEFINYQLSNDNFKKLFSDCSRNYNLDTNKQDELLTCIEILSKSYYETVPNGTENISDLNEHVGMYFIGDSNSARCLLQDFIDSNGIYGVKITSNDIITAMKNAGFELRYHLHNDNTIAKINELNCMFHSYFFPINNSLIHRKETNEIIKLIRTGKSVILHGKAGTGKSGCIQEFINTLDKENILYLALKLDRHIPSISSDHYGKDLGLQQSPVYSLYNLSGGKECVLILDQLDYLRWTSQHTSCALDICKEFISQMKMLNSYQNGRISILFVSRTFDLNTDPGLKALFVDSGSDENIWSKVQIGLLSEDEAKNIVGSRYNQLPDKLKNILLTPSTLYIWTSLKHDSSSDSVNTSFELMEKWWSQIQNECVSTGLDTNRILELKNSIVQKMESSFLLSLPESAFGDYIKELEGLCSNGLVVNFKGKVSFVHQSFLDYFAVSDMVSKVYDGISILEIIGEPCTQTPIMRYRILRILQNILETDELFFVKVSKEILNSGNIRHYFKCSIFEILGQCTQPSSILLNFAFEYYENNSWHDYVYKTVYLWHSNFVIDLDSRNHIDWVNEKGLTLLRSINSQNAEFVLSKITPICFKNEDTDIKAYNVLCHDCVDDTDQMFGLRLKLLSSNPKLLNNFWGVPQLVKKNSINLIPLLQLLINFSEIIKDHIYFGDNKNFIAYAKSNYREVIEQLLPSICEKTKHFKPQWPNYETNKEFSKWTNNTYERHFQREIVSFMKASMREYAINQPDDFMNFTVNFDNKNSVVYYEICSDAISHMDIIHSDFAISWICKDPLNHFLIYSGCENDYLSITKKVLKKFSKTCSKNSFENLEKIILNWKDPVKRMVNTYIHRIDVNKSKQYQPVYYAYWGHLQKELLPSLDKTRLSKYSLELIDVLQRNSWIHSPHYTCGFRSVGCMNVISPIENKIKSISDKTWIKIISTPSEKFKNKFIKDKTGMNYVDIDHHSFARSLSSQAKIEPVRFAKLSLQFPEKTYFEYISNVIRAMYNEEDKKESVDFQLMCKVINRYIKLNDTNIISECLRLVTKLPEKEWPSEIIDRICSVALDKDNCFKEQKIENSKKSTPHDLIAKAINSCRGNTLEAIGSILYNHPQLSEKFKPIVKALSNDKCDYIRLSTMFCLIPYFNIDEEFSINTFKQLIQTDVRTIGFYDAWEIICRNYNLNKSFYVEHLLKACDSADNETGTIAAGFLCALSIYYDNDLINVIFKKDLHHEQVDRVCKQAIFSFDKEEYHKSSKEFLVHYLNNCDYTINSLDRLFYDNRININRDETFLINLMNSNQCSHLLTIFLNYIKDYDGDISKYVNVIQIICKNQLSPSNDWEQRNVFDILAKCLIKILDRNKYDEDIKNKCLDMWDDLYKYDINSINEFSKMIEDII